MNDKIIEAMKEYQDYLYERFEIYKSHQTLKTYYLGKLDCAKELLEIINNVIVDDAKNNG